jgi:hypothetical protein
MVVLEVSEPKMPQEVVSSKVANNAIAVLLNILLLFFLFSCIFDVIT